MWLQINMTFMFFIACNDFYSLSFFRSPSNYRVKKEMNILVSLLLQEEYSYIYIYVRTTLTTRSRPSALLGPACRLLRTVSYGDSMINSFNTKILVPFQQHGNLLHTMKKS